MNDWKRVRGDTVPSAPHELPSDAIDTIDVASNGGVPNHPRLPAVHFRGAFDSEATIDGIKARFERNRWFRVWDWTVFDYHHYHPNAHEVLAVAAGSATLQLGGPEGPERKISTGDVLILPAGFGHRLEESRDGFTVVGAYPEGQEAREVVEADPTTMGLHAAHVGIVALPRTDPVYGIGGPLMQIWGDPGSASYRMGEQVDG